MKERQRKRGREGREGEKKDRKRGKRGGGKEDRQTQSLEAWQQASTLSCAYSPV